MAYREGIKSEELKQKLKGADFFWNISEDVGWGCANHWADVMLVQYFISIIWDSSVKKDGIFGPKTSKAIKDLQKACYLIYTADGKVDTVDGSRFLSTISKGAYTILILNSEFKLWKPMLYNDITMDNRLPAALRNELSRVVIDGDVIAMAA